ncbi:ubiquitin thioesterase OTUB1 isoform X1 [Pongo abelii]|uniref:ubiquitin thioesterase OTUB1 isoform X1 n=1 Tax=Pongo abelii TaxID=9601 RepID=UPI003005B22E
MAAEEPQQQKQEPLGSDSEGVNCLAYDEAIMAQQDRIQQEIAVQNPLVSERLELSVLYKEYAEDDNIYQQKIKDLHKKYSYIRKTRPDGNCFYRAFGFSHLEALLDDSKELQRFKAVSAKSKEDLVSQGFTEFTIEDFHNTFMDLIEQVEKQTSVADLLASFNDQSTSDYLVVYLRLLTSGYLQRESKFFEHFIEGGRTVKEFCQQVPSPSPLLSAGGVQWVHRAWGGVRRPGPDPHLCHRRWSPCARRATTSTSSRWPRPSACPSRWSTWTAARAAPPIRTSSLRAPSPRSTFSTGLDTTISSTNRAGPGPLLPCCPPLPGARHVQRFFCGCKWSYFTPFFLSHDPPCFIKGGAGGEPCVRVPALLPAWLLCLLPPPPRWVPLLFTYPPLSFPNRSRFEGPGLLEAPPASSASFPEAPLPFLAGSGASMGSWKFLGDLPRVPGPPTLHLLPHRPHLHVLAGPQTPASCPPPGVCMVGSPGLRGPL